MKVIKNIIYNTGYQVLMLIFPLLTVPYVSRILGKVGIGINTYTFSILSFFVLFANLSILTYGNREIAYVQDDKEKRSIIFWELVIIKGISTAISAVLFFLLLVFVLDKWHIYYLIQSIMLLATLFDISWYFMGVEEFKKIILRNTVVRVMTVIVTFVFVKEASDLWIYIATAPVSTLLGNLSTWSYIKNEIFPPNLKKLNLKRHLKPVAMLFLPQIIMQVYLALNKVMLGSMDSVVASGYFDQSDKIIRVGLTIVTSLSAAVIPRVSNLFSNNQHDEVERIIQKTFSLVNAIGILLMFGVMAVSNTFAVYFFGSEYEPVGGVMFIQSVMIVFVAWANITGMQYLLPTNRLKDFTLSALAGLVTNVGLNLLLIPFLGVYGATISTVATEAAVTLYQFWALRDTFKISSLLKDTWKYLLSGGVVFVAVRYLDNVMRVTMINYIIQATVGIAMYGLLLIVLRADIISELKNLLNTFRSKGVIDE